MQQSLKQRSWRRREKIIKKFNHVSLNNLIAGSSSQPCTVLLKMLLLCSLYLSLSNSFSLEVFRSDSQSISFFLSKSKSVSFSLSLFYSSNSFSSLLSLSLSFSCKWSPNNTHSLFIWSHKCPSCRINPFCLTLCVGFFIWLVPLHSSISFLFCLCF